METLRPARVLFPLIVALLAQSEGVNADPPFPVAATLSGIAGVKDGDGVLFGDVEVRLQGIAAPEDRRGQVDVGGKEATAALESLALGQLTVCILDGTTARRRPVGMCMVNGLDIGGEMVRTGFARDCPSYSRSRYARLEAEARAVGRDLSQIYALPDYCREG